MAIYTLQVKPISRKAGHSAIAKVSYTSRSILTDERTGEVHNYSKKKDLLFSEIICGEYLIDTQHRQQLWNKVETMEKRKDSRVAREYVIALPKELSLEDNSKLTREFVQIITKHYQCICDYSIHDQDKNNGNFHAHLVTSTRKFDVQKFEFSDKTDIELSNKKCEQLNIKTTDEQIKDIRKIWEMLVNNALKKANIQQKVSCEKKSDRTTVKQHLGRNATALEKKKIETTAGKFNREIELFKQLIAYLRKLKMMINNKYNELEKLKKLERLERQQAEIKEIEKLKMKKKTIARTM